MRGQSGNLFAESSIAAIVVALGALQVLGASETDQAVNRAARQYRMQVFETFHANRREYDRRLGVGNRVLQQWQSNGAPSDQAEGLVNWFNRASQASKPGTSGRLPRYQESRSKGRVTKPDFSPSKNQPTQRVPRTVRTPDRRRRRDPNELLAPSDPVLGPKRESDWTLTHEPQESQGREQSPLASVPETGHRSSGIARDQRLKRPAPQVSLRGSSLATVDLPSRRDDPLSEPSAASQLPKRIARRLPVPGPSALPQQAAPSAVNVSDGEFDLWERSPLGSAQFAPRPAPASNVVVASSSRESPIDLHVLAARIRASNLRLAEIESELTSNGLWDAKRLRPLVDRFEQMLAGRQLSQLYYSALNGVERQRVATFASIDPTVTILTQRLFEARVAATEDPVFFPPDSAEVNELQRLAQIVESWKSYLLEQNN